MIHIIMHQIKESVLLSYIFCYYTPDYTEYNYSIICNLVCETKCYHTIPYTNPVMEIGICF